MGLEAVEAMRRQVAPASERLEAMGGTELTSVMTGEGQAAVVLAVDHHRQRR